MHLNMEFDFYEVVKILGGKLTAFDFRPRADCGLGFSLQQLRHRLSQYQPTVVHIAAHGSSEGLLMADSQGKELHCSPTQIGSVLSASPKARLLLLSVCGDGKSADGSSVTDLIRAAFMSSTIRVAVVCWTALTSEANRLFFPRLYRCLMEGMTVGEAMSQARQFLLIANNWSFGTLVLYARTADDVELRFLRDQPMTVVRVKNGHPQPAIVHTVPSKLKAIREDDAYFYDDDWLHDAVGSAGPLGDPFSDDEYAIEECNRWLDDVWSKYWSNLQTAQMASNRQARERRRRVQASIQDIRYLVLTPDHITFGFRELADDENMTNQDILGCVQEPFGGAYRLWGGIFGLTAAPGDIVRIRDETGRVGSSPRDWRKPSEGHFSATLRTTESTPCTLDDPCYLIEFINLADLSGYFATPTGYLLAIYLIEAVGKSQVDGLMLSEIPYLERRHHSIASSSVSDLIAHLVHDVCGASYHFLGVSYPRRLHDRFRHRVQRGIAYYHLLGRRLSSELLYQHSHDIDTMSCTRWFGFIMKTT